MDMNDKKKETVGNITLDYSFYKGEDLYSDGDAVENQLLEIVRSGRDYSYALDEYVSWPVLYHLSRQRENITGPMDIKKADEVLEIGAGPGAVTGALARMAGHVDCIELSRRRSLINAWRHRDMDNIYIYVGNFGDIKPGKQYDVICLIGVLEYACYYTPSEDPYGKFLKSVRRLLKPDGKVYIAIENKLGMKYFAGYHEDHTGKRFSGIEGYKEEDHVRTFTRSELTGLVRRAGFSGISFYYPFPDYKFPTLILNDDTIRDAEIEMKNFTNCDMPVLSLFDQVKAMAALRGTKERKIFANSFLVEAVNHREDS